MPKSETEWPKHWSQNWVLWFVVGLVLIIGCTALAIATEEEEDEETTRLAPTPVFRARFSTTPTPTPTPDDSISTPAPASPTPTPGPTSTPTPPRTLPTVAELTASIEDIIHVRDTEVKYRDDDTVAITLLVDTWGQKGPARRIGDNAVRTIKEMVEGGVGGTIGPGAWEYIVIIFEPGNNDPLVVGHKRQDYSSIDWNVLETLGMGTPTSSSAATTRTAATSASSESMILSTIRGYSLVRDAAISQDGSRVNLVLIVDYAIDPDYARQLGDTFVRLAKSFLEDDPPGKAIGTGKYDYLIGIYYLNEKQLALGAKSRVSDRISW